MSRPTGYIPLHSLSPRSFSVHVWTSLGTHDYSASCSDSPCSSLSRIHKITRCDSLLPACFFLLHQRRQAHICFSKTFSSDVVSNAYDMHKHVNPSLYFDGEKTLLNKHFYFYWSFLCGDCRMLPKHFSHCHNNGCLQVAHSWILHKQNANAFIAFSFWIWHNPQLNTKFQSAAIKNKYERSPIYSKYIVLTQWRGLFHVLQKCKIKFLKKSEGGQNFNFSPT
jgi:hypothetical protein